MAHGVATGAAGGGEGRGGRARPQDVDRHVARRIRERRLMLGLTQQELAGRVGVAFQQAHKYEAGLDRISVGRLALVAEALGVGPGWFFEGIDGEAAAPPAGSRRPMVGLARAFADLDRPLQEAILDLARALARDGGEMERGTPVR